MIDQYQEKLVTAIQYFARNVRYPTKTKIFKLLFFLDEEHFKQTGLTVTNLDYFAWRYGPVPQNIWFDIQNGNVPDYFRGKLKIIPSKDDEDEERNKVEFRAISPPNLNVFSPRQIKILEILASIYRDATPSQVSSISHEANKPWALTIQKEGEKKKIDLTLALEPTDPITQEEAIRAMQERSEMINNFPLIP